MLLSTELCVQALLKVVYRVLVGVCFRVMHLTVHVCVSM